MSIREEAKNRRRRRITSAARQLMQEAGGDSGFSMRALAQAANVSIATPYNLFGSKQAIIDSVLATDLAQFRETLKKQSVDTADAFFATITLTAKTLAAEPEFYRSIYGSVFQGDEKAYQSNFYGPRHLFWKQMVKEAIRNGHLVRETCPDALAINIRNGFRGIITKWVKKELSISELEARGHHMVALSLAAMATEQSRVRFQARIRQSQKRLQSIWEGHLRAAMAAGPLDKNVANVAADQIVMFEKGGRRELVSTT